MRVLLTGATGFIGSAVAEKLLAHGHQVVGTARNDAAVEKLKNASVEAVHADLRDPSTLKKALEGVDAVIHTASSNDAESAVNDKNLIDAVLDVFKDFNKPFVYTSGVWVLGETGRKEVDENGTTDSPAQLVAWRVDAEYKVRAGKRVGIRAMVIRPGIVYGRGAGIPAMMFEGAKEKGAITYIGEADHYWAAVHVQDLADLYVLALESGKAGSIYHGVSESVQVGAAAAAASEGAGLGGKTVSLSLEQARAIMGPFAEALAMNQKIISSNSFSLGWKPKAAKLEEELKSGSYAV